MKNGENRLPSDEVHVWRIELDRLPEDIAFLAATLSQQEKHRAERFRTPELRSRWTVAHGALRSILATYLDSSPDSLVFANGPHGKPSLEQLDNDVHFSLSHSYGLALLAISRVSIGLDFEMIRTDVEIEKLSRRFFATGEAEEILALPTEERVSAFFACWTRKEAFVKLLGGGLSIPLDSFEVSVRQDTPATLRRVNGQESHRWSLLDLSESGFVAAIAVEGLPPRVRRLNFVPKPR